MRAFFLPVEGTSAGQRFCILHEAREPRGTVVYVHPWAEELNKSRRMVSLQARALADAGYTVLQIDLLGCGDSSGEFRDATWQAWVEDVVQACRWLQSEVSAPLWLWGLRAGCLLAAEAARALDEEPHLLFWQPVTSGKVALHQFLRVSTAAKLLGNRDRGTDVRQQLNAGDIVQVAGYELSPQLASGFEQALLTPPGRSGQVTWLELTSRDPANLAAASVPVIGRWRAAGYEVDARAVLGPGFWQTTEIEEAPALLDATVKALTATASA